MADRRPSLIDQMALAAALEADIEISSGEEEDSINNLMDDDDLDDPSDQHPEMVFNSDLVDANDDYVVELGGATQERRHHHHHHMHNYHVDDAHSHTGSEEQDAFHVHDQPLIPLNWRPPNDPQSANNSLDDIESFNMSSSSEKWDDEGGVSFDMRGRRPSFKQQQLRRASFQSIQSSEGSFHSAPARTGNESPSAGIFGMTGPDAGGAATKRRSSYSFRRPSVNIPTFGAGSLMSEDDTLGSVQTGGGSSSGSVSGSGKMRFGRITRPTAARSTMKGGPSASPGSLDQALESLTTHNQNTEWENVAAAVTVVAAGSQATGNSASRHIKFAVDDTVLVLLTLLNVTNMEDPKDTFTVAPVNKYGFPQGEGTTEEEKAGPYTFVLATVKHVHFDEDDRYYTVQRADTGSEQRADSGWIEPMRDPVGIEAATRAGKRTVRSAQSLPVEEMEETGLLKDVWGNVIDTLSWPAHFTRSKLLPWYSRQRANAKRNVTHLLYGDAPFACKVRVTGINFLAFCSFTFLFLEVVNLGFLPATYDREVSILGVVIWCILVLELIFEILIRPRNYMDLVESDRAFAPSTARHINQFHLIFEAIALITFIPEFQCLHDLDVCRRESMFNRVQASLDSVSGDTSLISMRGRFLMGITALRLFSLVRHWKQMFISNTFRLTKREGIEKWLIPGEKNGTDSVMVSSRRRHLKKHEDDFESMYLGDEHGTSLTSSEEDQRLKNAATIGTALMVINSQRALVLLTVIVVVLPLLQSLSPQNHVTKGLVDLLQAHNTNSSTTSQGDCDYLNATVYSWLNIAAVSQPDLGRLSSTDDTFVLWAQLLPVRCEFQREDGVITFCEGQGFNDSAYICRVWDDLRPENPSLATPDYFAMELDLRAEGIIREQVIESVGDLDGFTTTVIYNQNASVALTNVGNFFLLLGVLLVGLYGLTALRGEAIRLVLDPLQRMLKIVLRYAENPLSQDVKSGSEKNEDEDSALDVEAEEIGNYETEQLINAITKIADLLRKCWGIAGAGIISSNLARTKDGKTVVFNPTVPGKRVYALFGFVAINGFSEQLRALNQDVMILINDVAKVVHDEVYRWALGDHGQCNKNLGSAFLMVFRIGDFSEVQKKKQVATEKLFRDNAAKKDRKSYLRRRFTSKHNNDRNKSGRRGGRSQDTDGQLMLASLPGIQPFTDRALLGMLKSFAGVHRDKGLKRWKEDFRLTAGVSTYHVDIIYGMDAGWAVEGAVGSEYKIDATYLSPHVNMASRMMSATKQYGVTILLSKAVQELLSPSCRHKLRHLDTVYVKGSNVKQQIFTFDARHRGVDFFLLERTAEQADYDAETYSTDIWEVDRDLLAMRQHVSDKFLEVYHLGVQKYLAGKWEEAYSTLQRADHIMMETVLADGYLEYDLEELEGRLFDMNDHGEDIVRARNELGDGASRVLMTYMERRQLKAPDDWDAVRKLSSK